MKLQETLPSQTKPELETQSGLSDLGQGGSPKGNFSSFLQLINPKISAVAEPMASSNKPIARGQIQLKSQTSSVDSPRTQTGKGVLNGVSIKTSALRENGEVSLVRAVKNSKTKTADQPEQIGVFGHVAAQALSKASQFAVKKQSGHILSGTEKTKKRDLGKALKSSHEVAVPAQLKAVVKQANDSLQGKGSTEGIAPNLNKFLAQNQPGSKKNAEQVLLSMRNQLDDSAKVSAFNKTKKSANNKNSNGAKELNNQLFNKEIINSRTHSSAPASLAQIKKEGDLLIKERGYQTPILVNEKPRSHNPLVDGNAKSSVHIHSKHELVSYGGKHGKFNDAYSADKQSRIVGLDEQARSNPLERKPFNAKLSNVEGLKVANPNNENLLLQNAVTQSKVSSVLNTNKLKSTESGQTQRTQGNELKAKNSSKLSSSDSLAVHQQADKGHQDPKIKAVFQQFDANVPAQDVDSKQTKNGLDNAASALSKKDISRTLNRSESLQPAKLQSVMPVKSAPVILNEVEKSVLRKGPQSKLRHIGSAQSTIGKRTGGQGFASGNTVSGSSEPKTSGMEDAFSRIDMNLARKMDQADSLRQKLPEAISVDSRQAREHALFAAEMIEAGRSELNQIRDATARNDMANRLSQLEAELQPVQSKLVQGKGNAQVKAVVFREIMSAAETFRGMSSSRWAMTIEPLNNLRIQLNLSMAETQLVVQAKLERGSQAILASGWSDLQASLAEKDIDLKSLLTGSSREGHTNLSGGRHERQSGGQNRDDEAWFSGELNDLLAEFEKEIKRPSNTKRKGERSRMVESNFEKWA